MNVFCLKNPLKLSNLEKWTLFSLNYLFFQVTTKRYISSNWDFSQSFRTLSIFLPTIPLFKYWLRIICHLTVPPEIFYASSKHSKYPLGLGLEFAKFVQFQKMVQGEFESDVKSKSQGRRFITSDGNLCHLALSFTISYSGHELCYFIKATAHPKNSVFQESQSWSFEKDFANFKLKFRLTPGHKLEPNR